MCVCLLLRNIRSSELLLQLFVLSVLSLHYFFLWIFIRRFLSFIHLFAKIKVNFVFFRYFRKQFFMCVCIYDNDSSVSGGGGFFGTIRMKLNVFRDACYVFFVCIQFVFDCFLNDNITLCFWSKTLSSSSYNWTHTQNEWMNEESTKKNDARRHAFCLYTSTQKHTCAHFDQINVSMSFFSVHKF